MGGTQFKKGDGQRVSVTFLLVIAIGAAWPPPARAALHPPLHVVTADSVSSSVEKGIELVRWSHYAGRQQRWGTSGLGVAFVKWRIDQRSAEQEVDRVRQDGRWYAGGMQRTGGPLHVWAGAEGEHFDDRPGKQYRAEILPADLQPREVGLPGSALQLFQTAASAVRILRGGGGVVVSPTKAVTAAVGGGAVQDRRIGSREDGLGIWTAVHVDSLEVGGYRQSGRAEYNRETPRHHANSDLIGNYALYREFYPGNSNRAEASASLLSREIYAETSGSLSRRRDEQWAVRDVFNYQVHKMLSTEISAELAHDRTAQAGGGIENELVENQTGFGARLDATAHRYVATTGIDVRQVTQTIRGDVLQGIKTVLTVRGSAPAPLSSRVQVRFATSKYQLDTRSEANHDDRDELRYLGEVLWTKPLLQTLQVEAHASATLDHLVYIFAENSANNRWTRYFVAGARFWHRPNPDVVSRVAASVSANYSDYDYETNPRSTRSTVFRRLTVGDSTRVRIWRGVSAKMQISGQIEELGRLYWDSFEEARSDETRLGYASLEGSLRLNRQAEVAAGGIWDVRRSIRFPETEGDPTVVYQDYQTYGPTGSVTVTAKTLDIRVGARALRQLRLTQEDRWLYTGEAVIAWSF